MSLVAQSQLRCGKIAELFVHDAAIHFCYVLCDLVKPPFYWMAILLRFEILVKMTRIVTETARAQLKRPGRSRSVLEFQMLYRKDIKQKRNESVAPSPMS